MYIYILYIYIYLVYIYIVYIYIYVCAYLCVSTYTPEVSRFWWSQGSWGTKAGSLEEESPPFSHFSIHLVSLQLSGLGRVAIIPVAGLKII